MMKRLKKCLALSLAFLLALALALPALAEDMEPPPQDDGWPLPFELIYHPAGDIVIGRGESFTLSAAIWSADGPLPEDWTVSYLWDVYSVGYGFFYFETTEPEVRLSPGDEFYPKAYDLYGAASTRYTCYALITREGGSYGVSGDPGIYVSLEPRFINVFANMFRGIADSVEAFFGGVFDSVGGFFGKLSVDLILLGPLYLIVYLAEKLFGETAVYILLFSPLLILMLTIPLL